MLLDESIISKFYSKALSSASGSGGKNFVFCKGCGLRNGCKTPAMAATGEGNRGILFIAEAPGRTEDDLGIQLVGEAGQLLRTELRSLGLDLDKDARKINAVNCRPPRNRTPTIKEVQSCRPMVLAEIHSFRPKAIILLGETALKSYYMDRLRSIEFRKMRGWVVPDVEVGSWVVSTYHPSYLLRLKSESNRGKDIYRIVRREFRAHIKTALEKSEEPMQGFETLEEVRRKVVVLQEEGDVETVLRKALIEAKQRTEGGERILMAFDYETNALKPFAAGCGIVAASFCMDKDRSFAFRMTDNKRIRHLWTRLLTSDFVGKIAHNAKFEDLWTRKVFGAQVRPWVGDTMLMSHFLDNRGWISSLKFQTAIRFGILDYNSGVEAFLEPSSDEKARHGSLAINRASQAPDRILLPYCGLDSLFTFRLFHFFQSLISEGI